MFYKKQIVQGADFSKWFTQQSVEETKLSAVDPFISYRQTSLCQKEMFILYIYESSWGHKAAWVKISTLTECPCLQTRNNF